MQKVRHQQTATSRWEAEGSEKQDRMGKLSSSQKTFQSSTQRSLQRAGSLSSRRRTKKHDLGIFFFPSLFFLFFSRDIQRPTLASVSFFAGWEPPAQTTDSDGEGEKGWGRPAGALREQVCI